MLVLRLLMILIVLLLVVSTGMYLFTRDQRYLKFAWQTMRFTVFALLVFLLLYVLERYVLIGWRVLL